LSATKTQGAERIMVWCGVWDVHVIGAFFFHETVTGENYLNMLGDQMIPQLDELGGQPDWFMQDGPPPPHYALPVRGWLDATFSNRWIGRRGPVEWVPRSPDLNPLEFAFWGYLKGKVYSVKIQNLHYLQQRITDACAAVDPDTYA
jgi:hypothetical protein